MKLVDLHVHSNASDGTLSPSEVVAYAAKKELAAIALTDHDTIDGLDEALRSALAYPLEVIPGIELSCAYEGIEIHILGLFVNKDEPEFLKELEILRESRNNRNLEMIRRFEADGIHMSLSELQMVNPDTVITRAHFARLLMEKGYVSTMDQAFRRYLEYGGKYCLRKEKISPERAMEILTANHAFPVLAHPVLYKLGWERTEELISYLKGMGLQGLEVYHSSHNPSQSAKLRTLTKKYRLLPTGGSDFHGSNKPDIDIGSGRGGLRISSLLLEDIRNIRL